MSLVQVKKEAEEEEEEVDVMSLLQVKLEEGDGEYETIVPEKETWKEHLKQEPPSLIVDMDMTNKVCNQEKQVKAGKEEEMPVETPDVQQRICESTDSQGLRTPVTGYSLTCENCAKVF